MILQKEPLSSSVIDREDTYQQLLQYIKEGKIVIENMMAYHYMDQILKTYNKNIRLDSKHFELTLSIYFGLLSQVKLHYNLF